MTKLAPRELLLLGLVILALVYAFWIKPHQTQTQTATGSSDLRTGNRPARDQIAIEGSPVSTKVVSDKSARTHKKIGMTPAEAKKLMKNAASISDMQEQSQAYRSIMAELCEAGYVTEAWEMLLPDAGYNRDVQLAKFFYSVPLDPKTFSEKVATLEDPSEKKTALTSYLARNSDQYPGILENPEFKRIAGDLEKTDPHALAEILGTGLRAKFDLSSDPADKEKINGIVRELHSKNLITNADFSKMIAKNISRNPFELWSWVSDSSMGIDDPASFEGQIREGVVRGMVAKNAAEALTKIASDTGPSAIYDLGQGLTSWATNNPKAANEWYVNEGSKLTQAQQDSAAKAFANVALSYRELAGAENWANRISNTEIRNAILEKIHPKPPPNQ